MQAKIDNLKDKYVYLKKIWNEFEEIPYCIIQGDLEKQTIQIQKTNNTCLRYFHKDNTV